MINALKSLFQLEPMQEEQPLEHRLRLAAAALLIETARADFNQDGAEEARVAQLLQESLSLTEAEVSELVRLANTQVDVAISLYQFTRVINDHFTPEHKIRLIRDMWRVAYADGNLDKYEEHLIRRVADLIYVSHQDYIRVKLEAAD